jgi:lipopolysaccharide assembly outer membrane protein LptD (OstA)
MRNFLNRCLFTGMLACICLLTAIPAYAQNNLPQKPKKDTSQIEIRSADYLEVIQKRNVNIYRLVNNVILEQKELTLYCDSALLFKSENIAKIYGNVHLNQADSIHAYGDSAIYDGNTKTARLFSNAKITDKSMTLTTDDLSYDLNTKIATYYNGGTVTDGEAVLTSVFGYYYANTNDAFFKKEVVLTHPDYGLEADTLQYNTYTEKAIFRGPTRIFNKESTVYCEKGYYETNTGIAVFHQRAALDNPPQFLKADSIYYNRTTGIGKAYYNIIFEDTAQKVLQYSNYAEYDEINNTIFSTGGSIAGYVLDMDTLFIGGDTIRSFQDSLERRTMLVYHNVKIYKSDLQGRCDSLSYSDMDSVIRMYGLPVMWSDSSQFTADTVNMVLKNKTLSEIQLFSNGFIINEDDSLIYNQIKGRNIYGYFTNEDLTKIKAIGNGESIYFGKDEKDRYIGVNKMFCSEIIIQLSDKKFHRITFKNTPDSEFQPMKNINITDYQLKDFNWTYDERPLSKDDLLKDEPTQSIETEKPSLEKSSQKEG